MKPRLLLQGSPRASKPLPREDIMRRRDVAKLLPCSLAPWLSTRHSRQGKAVLRRVQTKRLGCRRMETQMRRRVAESACRRPPSAGWRLKRGGGHDASGAPHRAAYAIRNAFDGEHDERRRTASSKTQKNAKVQLQFPLDFWRAEQHYKQLIFNR